MFVSYITKSLSVLMGFLFKIYAACKLFRLTYEASVPHCNWAETFHTKVSVFDNVLNIISKDVLERGKTLKSYLLKNIANSCLVSEKHPLNKVYYLLGRKFTPEIRVLM